MRLNSQAMVSYWHRGGDDLRVLLWKVDNLGEKWKPLKTFMGHLSNIFSIEFDSQQKNLYSAGNDGFLIKYDIEHTTASQDMILAHEDSCLQLSISPISDNVILTAGQDWCIKLWDMRSRRQQNQLEEFGKRQNFVQFNPSFPNLFVTTDDRGGIYLHDIRSCFGRDHQDNHHLVKYTTKMAKGKYVSRPFDVTSAVWSSDGMYLGANIQRYNPLIYYYNEPDPLCVLKQDNYSSLATIKTGTFCDTIGQLAFFGGSDNGFAHGWKIPSKEEMTSTQKHTMEIPLDDEILFQNQDHNVKPMEIANSNFSLGKSNSIINTVIAHPTLPYIITAGVEKTISIHSAHEIPASIDKDASNVHDTLEDLETIYFFDRLVF
jgi:WD repeat-containing protein 22